MASLAGPQIHQRPSSIPGAKRQGWAKVPMNKASRYPPGLPATHCLGLPRATEGQGHPGRSPGPEGRLAGSVYTHTHTHSCRILLNLVPTISTANNRASVWYAGAPGVRPHFFACVKEVKLFNKTPAFPPLQQPCCLQTPQTSSM